MSIPAVSLIIISYNMQREIPRTIQSLSPGMQRGVTAEDYEIILIDNGSSSPVDAGMVSEWGANIQVHRMENPTVSPVPAINFGLSLARGRLCGVLIDGARLASPGIIAGAVKAARLHDRPIISTAGFHLGGELQQHSIKKGYNQAVEDNLLNDVDWTADGYRLFRIAVFAGSCYGGWFVAWAESNLLFMPRELWEELGGYDKRFVTSGGGLANLDIYTRACSLPGSQLVVLLGEGTFHQVHGGIATNAAESPWEKYHAEYVRIRGRSFAVPDAEPIYLGNIKTQALPSVFLSAKFAIGQANHK